MVLDELLQKLNAIALKKNPNGVKLFQDNYLKTARDFVKEVGASKVALFSDEAAFTTCKDLTDSLNNDVSLYNFILENKRIYSLSDFEESFSLNGTVGAVICLGGYALPVAKYFASVNNVPLLVVIADYRFESLFMDKITLIINGEWQDITLNTAKYIVFDKDLISSFDSAVSSDAFLLVQSKTCALINYRAHEVIYNKKAQPSVCAIVEDALTQGFDAEDKIGLATALLKIAAAHYLDNGFSLYSDEAVGEMIVNKDLSKMGAVRYALFVRFIEAYKTINIKDVANNLSVPFYSERADRISELTGVSSDRVAKYYSENRCSESVLMRLKPISKVVKADIDSLILAEEGVYMRFAKAGGNIEDRALVTSSQLKTALKYTADYPYFYGLSDVLRDVGVLESTDKLV